MQNAQQPMHSFNNIPTQTIISMAVNILNNKNITGHTFQAYQNMIIDKTDGIKGAKNYTITRPIGNNYCCLVVKDNDTGQSFIVHGFRELTTELEGRAHLDTMSDAEIASRVVDILNTRNIQNHTFTATNTGQINDHDHTVSNGHTKTYQICVYGNHNDSIKNVLIHDYQNNGNNCIVHNLNDIAKKIIERR